jgi:hypothetical protein
MNDLFIPSLSKLVFLENLFRLDLKNKEKFYHLKTSETWSYHKIIYIFSMFSQKLFQITTSPTDTEIF